VPTAASNGIEIFYETFGDPEDPTVLLVMGLGSQMIQWPTEMCEGLVDRGFHVVRFDNRDAGLSTWFDEHPIDIVAVFTAVLSGEPYEVPYQISDMAADAVGLLDHLEIPAAHVVGASMGGMIAQTIAIEHPQRVLSLTSIMSTTGDPDVGAPTPEVVQHFLSTPPLPGDGEEEEAVEREMETRRLIASPDHIDEDVLRAQAEAVCARGHNRVGLLRQLAGIAVSPSRTESLGQVTVPTLVVHGDADPLVTVSGGHRTAEAVPGAELLIIEGMGHDLPPVFLPQIIEGITRTAVRSTAGGN
jgi:pimeloyl-ACP methyl ester carboxylesterase